MKGIEVFSKEMKTHRKMLLLGGSSQQVVAIEAAKKIGLFTILCDYLPDNPGQYYADKFYQTSTTDKKSILEIAKKESIDYIIAYASDPAAPTAAFVAENLGLPTNPYKAVETLCNKDMFRNFLHSHGFNTPRAKGFNNIDEALADLPNYSFPIIIKPVDASGSKGITVLHDVKEAHKAIDFAFSFSRSRHIIIEEYIEKKHPYLIGGDIFISDGQVIQWGLMNCHRDSSVNPLVPVGKSYPILLEKADLQAVEETLQKLVTALGISYGPMNVELIIDSNNRVFPIDVGPRSGGNMIPDLLGMIFGCDVVEMSVRSAMGEKIVVKHKKAEPFYATFNLHTNQNGILNNIAFNPEIAQYIVRKHIYKQPGDEVHYFSNAADAIGIIFLKFQDQETMIQMEDNMNKYIQILVEKPDS